MRDAQCEHYKMNLAMLCLGWLEEDESIFDLTMNHFNVLHHPYNDRWCHRQNTESVMEWKVTFYHLQCKLQNDDNGCYDDVHTLNLCDMMIAMCKWMWKWNGKNEFPLLYLAWYYSIFTRTVCFTTPQYWGFSDNWKIA